MEPPTESVRHAELELAARVAAELEQGRQRGMDHVILVAPPRTLGDLREAISKPVQRLVTAELGKDLSRLTPHQLMEHLADQLAKS